MSIQKHITYVMDCDYCSESFDTDESDNFMWAIDRAKKEGWKIFKDGGEWAHKCPCCQEDSAEDDFE